MNLVLKSTNQYVHSTLKYITPESGSISFIALLYLSSSTNSLKKIILYFLSSGTNL